MLRPHCAQRMHELGCLLLMGIVLKPPPPPRMWKNCLLWNWSLVPESVGTAALRVPRQSERGDANTDRRDWLWQCALSMHQAPTVGTAWP